MTDFGRQMVALALIAVVGLAIWPMQAARAARKPVLLTTFYTDKTSLAPQLFASSLLLNFQRPYIDVTCRILKGERGGYYEMRPGAGMTLMPPKNVPADVTAKVNDVFRSIVKRDEKIDEVIDRVVERRR